MKAMKYDKLNHGIASLKAKIADYQNRLDEMERKKTELENTEILTMVREFELTPAELRALITANQRHNTHTDGKEETSNEE